MTSRQRADNNAHLLLLARQRVNVGVDHGACLLAGQQVGGRADDGDSALSAVPSVLSLPNMSEAIAVAHKSLRQPNSHVLLQTRLIYDRQIIVTMYFLIVCYD